MTPVFYVFDFAPPTPYLDTASSCQSQVDTPLHLLTQWLTYLCLGFRGGGVVFVFSGMRESLLEVSLCGFFFYLFSLHFFSRAGD